MFALPSTQRTTAVLIALVAAAALVVLGIPRTLAAFGARPGDTILSHVRLGSSVRSEAIQELAESRKAALKWSNSGRYWAELALAQLLLARLSSRDEVEVAKIVRQGAAALENGLARTPVDPHAWTRLAYARSLLDASPRDIVTPLMMSIYVGPHEPKLVFIRLRLCLGVWEHLSDPERDDVYRQVRFAWKRSKRRLLELAEETMNFREIRVALLQDPDELLRFERGLRKRRERRARRRK